MDAATAAVIAGPAVGAVAIVAAGLQSRGERGNDRAMARSERQFSVKKEVYVDLLRYARTAWIAVARTEPIFAEAGAPGPPEPPPDEEWIAMEARAAAFASPEVRAAFEALGTKVGAFRGALFVYRNARDRPSGATAEQRKEMDGARDKVKESLDRLEEVVRDELAST